MSAPKKRGLGRGLEALLGPKAAETPPPEAQPGEALRTLPVALDLARREAGPQETQRLIDAPLALVVAGVRG